jgi:excinuclease ABC subunit A
LIANLKQLVKTGSTLIVVEHDADTIRAADYLIEVGPEGGTRGGQILACGAPKQVLASDSPTAVALRTTTPLRAGEPRKSTTALKQRSARNARAASRAESGAWLELYGVTQHNLQAVDLKLPLRRFNVIAGVSGSGKSTLVRSVLLPAVRHALGLVAEPCSHFVRLTGSESLKRALSVDQSPIGRTPRSVPATFLGIWDEVRKLFAVSKDAMVAGFGASHFSFNAAAGGRCHVCEGQGVITHEMSFLPDVVQPCPACQGMRFEPETLRVRYAGMNAGEVLGLSVEEAAQAFQNHPKITRPLTTLLQLGAGYIKLGQGSHTLSGGEAQRLKLAAELTAGSKHEATLYVLDEPTTGLHQADVEKLIGVLDRLVDRGDTLVVIEHHPLVIASADHVVELGPEAGERGGRIIAAGSPQQLVKARTATAQAIQSLFA